MEILTTRRIVAATTMLAIGAGTLTACGKEQNESKTGDRGITESCEGLPAYKVMRRSKSGDPYIKFASKKEDCYLYLYDGDSHTSVPNSYIDRKSELLVCDDEDKHRRLWTSIIVNGDIDNTGYVDLSQEASRQLARNQDIPPC